MAAINTIGMAIPIAVFAPLDNPALAADVGLGVLEPKLVAAGATLTLVLGLKFEVGLELEAVPFCAASKDTICMSVLCHITGMPSHNAEVSWGTTHCEAMLFLDGILNTDPTVGVADQMFVNVCEAERKVLQPWAVRVVVPPTQVQAEGQHITAVVDAAMFVAKPQTLLVNSHADVHPLGHIPGE